MDLNVANSMINTEFERGPDTPAMAQAFDARALLPREAQNLIQRGSAGFIGEIEPDYS
jgi:hypothetical protein